MPPHRKPPEAQRFFINSEYRLHGLLPQFVARSPGLGGYSVDHSFRKRCIWRRRRRVVFFLKVGDSAPIFGYRIRTC